MLGKSISKPKWHYEQVEYTKIMHCVWAIEDTVWLRVSRHQENRQSYNLKNLHLLQFLLMNLD